ncbi:hypothetical protein DIPPA_08355 [Diplonema papillatum]|nr:hypothetical protein DIPPA_08355 [Diplonema papillatum]
MTAMVARQEGGLTLLPANHIRPGYRHDKEGLKNEEGKLIGIMATRKLNLPTAPMSSSLRKIPQEDIVYVRVGSKIDHSGKPQTRVLIVHLLSLLVTDLSGRVKRYLPFPEIGSVIIQPSRGKTSQDPLVWQILVQPLAEHDSLFCLTESKHNPTSGDGEAECRRFKDIYEQIASAFCGRPMPVEWRDQPENLFTAADLTKKKSWLNPMMRYQHTRKASVDSQQAPGSPSSPAQVPAIPSTQFAQRLARAADGRRPSTESSSEAALADSKSHLSYSDNGSALEVFVGVRFSVSLWESDIKPRAGQPSQ